MEVVLTRPPWPPWRGFSLLEVIVAMGVMGVLMGAGVLLYRQFARVSQKTMASLESREALTAGLQLLADRVQESNSSGLRVGTEKPARSLTVSRITGLSTQGNLTWSNDLSLFWFDLSDRLLRYRVCSARELQALSLTVDGAGPMAPSPDQIITLVKAPERTLRRFAFQDASFDLDASGILRVSLETRNTAKSITVTKAFHFKL